jgi:polysaccharide pyruvyl transferase WcaK-like protein
MKKAYLSFNQRNDNLGDVIICHILYEILKENLEVKFVGPTPYIHSKITSISPKKRYIHFAKDFLLKNDIYEFVSPGGPVFSNNKNTSIGRYINLFLNRFKKTIFPFSSITNLGSIKTLKTHLDLFNVFLIRDNKSLKLLNELNITKKSNVFKTTDISFYLNYEFQKRTNNKKIAVSFRSSIPEKHANINEQHLTLFKLVSEINNNIEYCYQVDEDLDYLTEIFPNNIYNKLDFYNWEKYYNQFDVILTNRLHVALMAMSRGVIPIVSTSPKHSKLISIFKENNLEELLVCDINNINKSVNFIFENCSNIRDKMRLAFSSNRASIIQDLEEVIK